MQLKRIYDLTGKEPVLDHVKILTMSKNQNFTQKRINEFVESGLATMSKGMITLHTKPEVAYKIVRAPGIFCCHDNKKLGSDKDAQKYMMEKFKGKPSPDKNNPAGYRKDSFFATELIED